HAVFLGAWPRHAFTRIGLSDDELVRDHDDEFNYRLLEHGGRIWLSPTIQSRYTTRSSAGRLWRQYFQYGHWKVRVMQKHPAQMRLRQFVPALFVMTCALAVLATPLTSWAVELLAAIIGAYVTCNLIASIAVARLPGWRVLVRLLLIFAILHVAYGLGFVAGLARFSRRWRDRRGLTPHSADADRRMQCAP